MAHFKQKKRIDFVDILMSFMLGAALGALGMIFLLDALKG